MTLTFRSPIACLAFLSLAVAPAALLAQSRGTTTTGMFGTQSLGSVMGSSPAGMGTGMTTGMGANNPSNTMGGAGGAAGASGAGSLGGAGMQNFTPGGATGFVGNTAATVTNPLGRQNAANAAGMRGANFGSLTNLMRQSQQNQFNQQQAQKASRTANQPLGQFRVPLRLGFQPPAIAPQRLNAFSTRLTKIPGLAKVGPVEATLEGRTAVLRGSVATEADRQLAEGLARLEPEVLTVRNELVVGSAGPAATAPGSAARPGATAEALPPGPAAPQ